MATVPSLKWSWSFVFHLVVLGVLLFNFKQAVHFAAPVATTPKPTIEAVALDQSQIQAEVDRLNAIEAKKKLEEKKHLAELDRKTKEAEKERKQEQAKLEKIKKEAEELKLATVAAEKQRKEQEQKLKKEQAIEAQKLAKLKQEQKALEEQKAEEQLAEKKKADQKKAESAKLAKVNAEKKAKEEAEAAIQDVIAREGQQQRFQTELQRYMGLLQSTISDHWIKPIGIGTGLKCVVEVKLSASGEVLHAKVVRSSGNTAFDRSSEAAIQRASPLPVPSDAHLFNQFRNFNFTFNPESV